MTCRHPLPTFDEIPPASSSVGRDLDGFLRLQLLPSDDADLRAKATEWFIASERQDGTEGTLSHDEFQIVLKRLSDVPARTPGGLAWKLVTVLDYFARRGKMGLVEALAAIRRSRRDRAGTIPRREQP